MKVAVQIDDGGFMPEKAYDSDAGFDIFSPEQFRVAPFGWAIIYTKVHFFIPDGYVGMIKSKSGLNIKHHLTAEGVIDAGYTGEVVVKVYNHQNTEYIFEKGDKITQMVILPIPKVELENIEEFNVETERGNNGFGSTGR